MKVLNCYVCGREVENIGENAIKVKCSNCVIKEDLEKFGFPKGSVFDPDKNEAIDSNNNKIKKPRGWAFMNEFVDSEGNVYCKGKLIEENSKKEPTKIKPTVKKKKVTRREASIKVREISIKIKELRKDMNNKVSSGKNKGLKTLEKELNKQNKLLEKYQKKAK